MVEVKMLLFKTATDAAVEVAVTGIYVLYHRAIVSIGPNILQFR